MSITLDTQNDGTYRIKYDCYDIAGNITSKERNVYITKKIINYYSVNSGIPGAFQHIIFFPPNPTHSVLRYSSFNAKDIILSARNSLFGIIPHQLIYSNVNTNVEGIYEARFNATVNLPGGKTYIEEISVPVTVSSNVGPDPPPIHDLPPGEIEP